MKRETFSFAAIGIWLICVASLVGIHIYKGKRPTTKEFMAKGRAIFLGLNEEEKTNVARYDTAIIRLNDGSFKIIGRGHESEDNNLLTDNKLSAKKIEIRIIDPVLLERRIMVSEAMRTLNNSEIKCLEDHFAAIIYRNGEYFLYLDPVKYSDYVLKYGTECKQCDEQNKNNLNK